jgi:hypothetical protein
MANDQEIAKMPIQQVVLQPGGNGLSSPPFQIPLNILGIFGWHNIETGVEACICDGALIPKTKAKTEFVRLIGRRSFVRRVLLQPGPLEFASTAFTQDELKLTLNVSVKFEVIDPVYVSSLSDPLSELRNLFEGITSEFIRSESLFAFTSDQGKAREQLKVRFQNSGTVKAGYVIHEVLKAIPSGDEGLIDIKRKTRIAAQENELIEVEGINRELESQHNLVIARKEAELAEEIAQNKHEREKEIRELEARADIMKTAISTLGEVAKSGIDPTKLAKDVIGTLVDRVQNTRLASSATPSNPEIPPVSSVNTVNQLEIEKNALNSIKGHLGIVTYEVLESQSKIKGAIIQLKDYEIILKCGDNYPQDEPEATVRFSDGKTQKLDVGFWISGVSSSLAQAVMVIIPLINTSS